jgi:hypothetical protein
MVANAPPRSKACVLGIALQKYLADVTGLDAKRGGPEGMQWKVKT